VRHFDIVFAVCLLAFLLFVVFGLFVCLFVCFIVVAASIVVDFGLLCFPAPRLSLCSPWWFARLSCKNTAQLAQTHCHVLWLCGLLLSLFARLMPPWSHYPAFCGASPAIPAAPAWWRLALSSGN
jgi:hypothetical protein